MVATRITPGIMVGVVIVGERDGRRAVQDLYDDDCNNALGRSFTRDVNRMKQRKFSSSRNWLGEIVPNDCANDAVDRKSLNLLVIIAQQWSCR